MLSPARDGISPLRETLGHSGAATAPLQAVDAAAAAAAAAARRTGRFSPQLVSLTAAPWLRLLDGGDRCAPAGTRSAPPHVGAAARGFVSAKPHVTGAGSRTTEMVWSDKLARRGGEREGEGEGDSAVCSLAQMPVYWNFSLPLVCLGDWGGSVL